MSPAMPRQCPPSTPKPPADLADKQAWVFDLDNTLYCATSNLFAQIDVRMKSFIGEFLGVAPDEAFRIQKAYFREYGTTLRGLMIRHGLDPQAFLDHVHDIDLGVIGPDPALGRALAALGGRKIVFTNGSVDHALRVLERLGIDDHFEAVFDIAASNYVPKPNPAVYRRLIEAYDIDPRASVMVEDMARNLEPAAEMGMITVWVRTDSDWGREGSEADYVHHVVDDLASWLGTIVET